MEIAYCGLDCGACPAFHAVERLTVEERQAVADKWNVEFGGTHTTADIDCVGCTSEGKHAECARYGCEKLFGFLANVPDAKANLEARRLS